MRQLKPQEADGFNLPLVQVSDYIDYRVLAAGSAETVTIPNGANYCVVIPNADCYIKASAAAVPSADVTDGSGAVYIPAGSARIIPMKPRFTGATSFSIVSPQTAIVSLEFLG